MVDPCSEQPYHERGSQPTNGFKLLMSGLLPACGGVKQAATWGGHSGDAEFSHHAGSEDNLKSKGLTVTTGDRGEVERLGGCTRSHERNCNSKKKEENGAQVPNPSRLWLRMTLDTPV